MCGSKPDLPPARDPKAERLAIEAEATRSANAKTADMRRSRKSQSLLASGAQGSTGQVSTSSVLAQGKDRLGG